MSSTSMLRSIADLLQLCLVLRSQQLFRPCFAGPGHEIPLRDLAFSRTSGCLWDSAKEPNVVHEQRGHVVGKLRSIADVLQL